MRARGQAPERRMRTLGLTCQGARATCTAHGSDRSPRKDVRWLRVSNCFERGVSRRTKRELSVLTERSKAVFVRWRQVPPPFFIWSRSMASERLSPVWYEVNWLQKCQPKIIDDCFFGCDAFSATHRIRPLRHVKKGGSSRIESERLSPPRQKRGPRRTG